MEMTERTIFVHELNDLDEETLSLIFESKRNGGGDVEEIQILQNGKMARITFIDAAVAAAMIEKSVLTTNGMNLKISADPTSDPKGKPDDQMDADFQFEHSDQQLLVEAESTLPSEEMLLLYFENKKSGGDGEIEKIIPHDRRTATIIFKKKEAIKGILNKGHHKIGQTVLKVSVLENLPELGDVSSCAVEVTDIPSRLSQETLHLFLENKRCDGGDVEDIFYDPENGKAVVTFQSADVALRVSRRQSLKLENDTFQVRLLHPQSPPPMLTGDADRLKFLVTHLPPEFDDLELSDFFRNATGKEVIKISRSHNPSKAIVAFSRSPDYIECRRLVIRKPFRDRMISIQRLPLCMQVIVFPIPSDLSEDIVLLHFESPRFGGAPTRGNSFDHENKYAIITYDDSSVVDQIMQRSHMVNGHELNVDFFYEDFGPPPAALTQDDDNWKRLSQSDALEASTISVDNIVIDCEPSYIRFMTENHDLKKRIEMELHDHHCEVIWPTNYNDGQILLRLIVASVVKSKERFSTEKWKEICCSLIKKQFDLIKTDKLSIDAELWSSFNSQISTISEDGENIILDKSDSDSCVYFVGFEKSVEKFRQNAEQLLKQLLEHRRQENEMTTEVDENFTLVQLQLLQLSDFIPHIMKSDVEISIDDTGVKYLGMRHKISDARKNLLDAVAKFKSKKYSVSTVKLNALQNENTRKFVEALLNEKEIRVQIEVNENEVILHGLTDDAIVTATDFLDTEFDEKEIALNDESILVLTMPQWSALLSKLQSKYPATSVLVSEAHGTLLCFARKSEMSEVITEIEELIKFNVIDEMFLEVSKNAVDYIDRYMRNDISMLQSDLTRYHISIDTKSNETPTGFRISGTNSGVTIASEKVKALADSVLVREYSTGESGVKKAIKTKRGQDFIVALEARNKLIIKTNESYTASPAAVDFQLSAIKVEELIIKLEKNLPSGIAVKITQGNILKCKADVLVNPSSQSLSFTEELSKLIVEKGGSSIVDECKQFIRSNGQLLECQFFVSGAGNLPFKVVMHTVSPVWKNGDACEIEYLTDCIVNILKESGNQSFESVALPLLVNITQNGFPPSSAANAIIEGIREFSNDFGKSSSLKTIHLVVDSDQMVNHFIKASAEFLGDSTIRSSDVSTQLATMKSETMTTSHKSFNIDASSNILTTQEGIKIHLISGLIAEQTTDVIVNTTTSDMKFGNGAVSKSILEAAGKEIEQECRAGSNGGTLAPSKIISTKPFKLKCKAVFHVACLRWDGDGLNCEKTTRELLKLIFETASQRNYSSVSLPAIGTGLLQIPKLKAASMMYEEAINFSKRAQNNKLKTIHFVVYNKDNDTDKAFKRYLSSLSSYDPSNVMQIPTRRKRQVKEKEMAVKKSSCDLSAETFAKSFVAEKANHQSRSLVFGGLVELAIVEGDITDQATDAIVNCTNKTINLKLGAVSVAIAKKGGAKVVEACKKIGKLTDGVAVTEGGNLQCRKIIHLEAADDSGDWETVIHRGLTAAEQLKLNSVSFPLLGTGQRGIDPKFMSSQFAAAITEFVLKDKPQHVKKLFVVIYQSSLVDTFAKSLGEMVKLTMTSKGDDAQQSFDQCDKGETSLFDVWSPPKDKILDRHGNYSLIFNITARSNQDIEAAFKEIDEFGHEFIKDVVLDSEQQQKMIAALSEPQVNRIQAIENSLDVKITVERSRRINRIRIRGDANDVTAAISEITDIFHMCDRQVRQDMEARLIAREAQWEFSEGVAGYEPYPADINKIIETAFKEKKQFAKWEEVDGTFQIDFSSMMETKESDPDSQIKVKRSGNIVIKYPISWEQTADNEAWKLVRLDPGTNELLKVEDLIQQTCRETVSEILRVERIQNPTLYKQYAAKKELMEVVYANSPNVKIERHLWHGTKEDIALDICRYGFNRSYSGLNVGAVHGKGAYFASEWAYSAQGIYSKPNDSGEKFIILATVLTGEFTKSNKDYIDAPLKSNNSKVKYDSVVDEIANPKIFVVFSDHQAYPEYLIRFVEKDKKSATGHK